MEEVIIPSITPVREVPMVFVDEKGQTSENGSRMCLIRTDSFHGMIAESAYDNHSLFTKQEEELYFLDLIEYIGESIKKQGNTKLLLMFNNCDYEHPKEYLKTLVSVAKRATFQKLIPRNYLDDVTSLLIESIGAKQPQPDAILQNHFSWFEPELFLKNFSKLSSLILGPFPHSGKNILNISNIPDNKFQDLLINVPYRTLFRMPATSGSTLSIFFDQPREGEQEGCCISFTNSKVNETDSNKILDIFNSNLSPPKKNCILFKLSCFKIATSRKVQPIYGLKRIGPFIPMVDIAFTHNEQPFAKENVFPIDMPYTRIGTLQLSNLLDLIYINADKIKFIKFSVCKGWFCLCHLEKKKQNLNGLAEHLSKLGVEEIEWNDRENPFGEAFVSPDDFNQIEFCSNCCPKSLKFSDPDLPGHYLNVLLFIVQNLKTLAYFGFPLCKTLSFGSFFWSSMDMMLNPAVKDQPPIKPRVEIGLINATRTEGTPEELELIKKAKINLQISPELKARVGLITTTLSSSPFKKRNTMSARDRQFNSSSYVETQDSDTECVAPSFARKKKFIKYEYLMFRDARTLWKSSYNKSDFDQYEENLCKKWFEMLPECDCLKLGYLFWWLNFQIIGPYDLDITVRKNTTNVEVFNTLAQEEDIIQVFQALAVLVNLNDKNFGRCLKKLIPNSYRCRMIKS